MSDRNASDDPAADAQEQGQEPTMEEILASIRRIISEDDEEEPIAAPRPEPEPEPEEDVLELTDVVEEDRDVVNVEGDFDPREPVPDELLEVEEEEQEAAPAAEAAEPAPEPPPAPEPDAEPDIEVEEAVPPDDEVVAEEAAPEIEREPLISVDAAQVVSAAFAQLSGTVTSGAPGSGRTLEELVQDLLRPMIKAWLDENLPPIVERMVEREIARIAGRSR